MKYNYICFYLFVILVFLITNNVTAGDFSVVVSVTDYKMKSKKYDEISDPDVYFDIIYNGRVIETSDTVIDNNFHSFGDIKPLGNFCQGIGALSQGDNVVIKFYDSDFDTNIVKRFWEWIQASLYKYIAYFGKQVELMNDSDKLYDDNDAYKAATQDPEMKRRENNLTDNVMKINERRNNRKEFEYMGECSIEINQAINVFKSGKEIFADSYKIKNEKTGKKIGNANIIIKKFDGFGSSLKVRGY